MVGADTILFGNDPTPGIVAVEPGTDSVRLYRRVDGAVVTEDRPFKRWILTTEKHSLANAEWTELHGDGFSFLAEFPDRESYNNARFWLRDAHASHISPPSVTKQYLIRTGQTLFKGMEFEDALRLQLDIETLSLSPDHPDNEIIMVAISDNAGFETVVTGDETSILKQTVACVRDRDPDIIEGHNIHGFDFPYLCVRAKMRGVRLALGRDGSEVVFGNQQNCSIGYFSKPFVPAHIRGRQVIDTLLALQRWDVSRGSLSSYGLKAAAQALGCSEDDRELIPHDRIASTWRKDPERVMKYAAQDVRETRALAALVCPPEFYLSQMIPETYASGATGGTGEKINSIFIREYLRQGRAVPQQSEPKSLPGGYTEVRRTGVVEPIVKCDVESLYPSIMISRRIKPENDTLNVFLPALEELTRRRFDAKKKSRQGETHERAYWDGMQSAFKILINSFYGYLGGPFSFNDYTAAARVTTTGQTIVKRIVEELEKSGSAVVEIDTDGVYFKPPADVDSLEAEIEYVERIGAHLPEGIRLAHDGRYMAMLSLKMKNYVLRTYDCRLIFRGSALRSRADERFGAEFISAAADCLLQGQPDDAVELYRKVAREIGAGELNVDKFGRRERITEKTFVSPSKKRVARAIGDAKVGDFVTVYQRNDGTIGLVHDYDGDEDRDYLLDKLYKFACRLKEGFGGEFDEMFPRPSAASRSEAAGQQTLDLFG